MDVLLCLHHGWGEEHSSPAGIPQWRLLSVHWCPLTVQTITLRLRCICAMKSVIIIDHKPLFCRSILIKTFALKSVVWALHFALCSLATGKDEIPYLTITHSCASRLSLRWRVEPGILSPLGSAFPSEHPSALSPILAWSCPQSYSDFKELGAIFSTVAMTSTSHCSAPAIHTRKSCSEEHSA